MRPSHSLFILFSASIVVLIVLNFVLTRNQAAGVYPILFEGLVTIGLVFVASCIGLLIPARGLLRVVGLLFSVIAALLLAESAWLWFIAYFGLLALCFMLLFKKHAAKNL